MAARHPLGARQPRLSSLAGRAPFGTGPRRTPSQPVWRLRLAATGSGGPAPSDQRSQCVKPLRRAKLTAN